MCATDFQRQNQLTSKSFSIIYWWHECTIFRLGHLKHDPRLPLDILWRSWLWQTVTTVAQLVNSQYSGILTSKCSSCLQCQKLSPYVRGVLSICLCRHCREHGPTSANQYKCTKLPCALHRHQGDKWPIHCKPMPFHSQPQDVPFFLTA